MFLFYKRASKYSCRFFISSIMLLVLSLFSLSYASDSEIKVSEIKVLALYTKGVTARYKGSELTRINHLINISNKVFQDSDIHATLSLVHSEEVDYVDNSTSISALEALQSGTGIFSNVKSLRSKYGADIVILFRPYYISHENCGIAYIGGYNKKGNMSGYANLAYAHVGIDTCPDSTTIHEIGHNLGALHSRKQDSSGGTFSYALGYGVEGKFVDIMAYPSEFNLYSNSTLYKFSNPMLECMGEPCGVERDQADSADASFALNITAPQVANYYGDSDAQLVSTRKAVYMRMVQVKRDLNSAKLLASVAQEKVDKAENIVTNYKNTLDELTTSSTSASLNYQNIQTNLATLVDNLKSIQLNYKTKNETGLLKKSFWLKVIAKREASIIYEDLSKFITLVQTAQEELKSTQQSIDTSTQSIRSTTNRLKSAEANLQAERKELAPLAGTVSWLQNSFDALSTEYTRLGGNEPLPD
jgi:hypothetical protein